MPSQNERVLTRVWLVPPLNSPSWVGPVFLVYYVTIVRCWALVPSSHHDRPENQFFFAIMWFFVNIDRNKIRSSDKP